jgi:mRNA interferase MazF
VLSPDAINRASPVIVVAPLTSKRVERIYPFEALIEPPEGALAAPSRVLLLHMRGIDRRRIVGVYGTVSAACMARVEEALRVVTGLRQL